MSQREQLVCECGGKLERPIPKACPHCGAVLTGVKIRLWPTILGFLVVFAMFVTLIAFAIWLVQR
ncbi:MAG: hypothetical protein ACI9HK_003101 [Pirellulaceae bacterium]|jgi:hypothetical protein